MLCYWEKQFFAIQIVLTCPFIPPQVANQTALTLPFNLTPLFIARFHGFGGSKLWLLLSRS